MKREGDEKEEKERVKGRGYKERVRGSERERK